MTIYVGPTDFTLPFCLPVCIYFTFPFLPHFSKVTNSLQASSSVTTLGMSFHDLRSVKVLLAVDEFSEKQDLSAIIKAPPAQKAHSESTDLASAERMSMAISASHAV